MRLKMKISETNAKVQIRGAQKIANNKSNKVPTARSMKRKTQSNNFCSVCVQPNSKLLV